LLTWIKKLWFMTAVMWPLVLLPFVIIILSVLCDKIMVLLVYCTYCLRRDQRKLSCNFLFTLTVLIPLCQKDLIPLN